MSELIAELRSKKAVLKQLKKELKAKRKKASKAQKKKAKEVLSTIKTAIKSANKAERKNIDLKDLLNLGIDIVEGVVDVAKDGKITVDEVVVETLEVVEEHVDNELVKDIAQAGQDALEDGNITIKEVVDESLDIVEEHAKNETVKDLAKAAKEILKDGKTDVGEILGVTAEVFKDEIEKAGLTEIITTMADIFEGVTTLEDLIKKGKEALIELAKQALKKLITEFVNKFLNKGIKKELIKIKYQPPRSKWGRLSMGVGLDLSMTGELSGNFDGNAVKIKTTMNSIAFAEGDLRLDVGFTIPVIDKRVDGELLVEVKGDLHAHAKAEIELTAKNKSLRGELKPTRVYTDYDMTGYLTIPDWIVDLWNGAAEWSFGYLDPIDATFTKKLGRHELFNIEIPGYKASFSMKTFEFNGAVNGNYSFSKGKDVENVIKKIENYLPW